MDKEIDRIHILVKFGCTLYTLNLSSDYNIFRNSEDTYARTIATTTIIEYRIARSLLLRKSLDDYAVS